jgi:hypothetical protein
MYFQNTPYLRIPITHSKMPTRRANSIASSVYNSSVESTILDKVLETKSETNATGPMASCLDEPKIA